MHDIEHRGFRYTIAAAGFAASVIFLFASAWANYRYGHSLAKSETDGLIYGAAAAACDVLMAASPFFFFAGLKNRSITQMLAAFLVWAIMTGVAAVSAISQTSVNRIDALSARITKSTSYADTRDELKQARQDRGFIPQHRPEATVQAEMEKLKTNRQWSLTNECSDPAGKTQRDFCGSYQTLKAEMGYAQSANKLDTRIADLVAKSDAAVAAGGSVVASEVDPAATSIATLTRMDIRTTQTLLVSLIAIMFLVGAGLGPYVSWSIMEAAQRSAVNTPIDIEATVVDITPSPIPAAAPLPQQALPAPQKAASGKPVPAGRVEPAPEWRALLTSLGYPEPGWIPPRDKKGKFILRGRDHKDVVAFRFWVWLLAHNETGKHTPARLSELHEEWARLDFKEPWADRIVFNRMRTIQGKSLYGRGNPVVWTVNPVDIGKVKALLVKRGIEMAPIPAAPAAQVTEDGKPMSDQAGGRLISMLPFLAPGGKNQSKGAA